jgi:hypothetical protein
LSRTSPARFVTTSSSRTTSCAAWSDLPPLKELSDWRGNRAEGFPQSNKFS